MNKNQMDVEMLYLSGLEDEEAQKKRKELDCRSMIDSILCYHYSSRINAKMFEANNENAELVITNSRCLKDYIKVLGKRKVKELIKDQIKSIKEIRINTYTDCEGGSYNSIVYAD